MTKMDDSYYSRASSIDVIDLSSIYNIIGMIGFWAEVNLD